jgi:hypothetical protein
MPGFSPHAHQMLAMWWSLSGAALIGTLNDHATKHKKKLIVAKPITLFVPKLTDFIW